MPAYGEKCRLAQRMRRAFLKTENLQQTSPDSYEIENNDTTWSYRTLFN